jgi:hypothetical protein
MKVEGALLWKRKEMGRNDKIRQWWLNMVKELVMHV